MPLDPISGGSGASGVDRDLAGPGDVPSRFDSGTAAEVLETAEMVQNSWDQAALDLAADVVEERRGFGTDNERATPGLVGDAGQYGVAQEAMRDQQVVEAEELVDDYREAQSAAAAAERDVKEAEMAEAHERGEAYYWGETTYDGDTVEKWILPDGTVLLVDGDDIVSVDYPDGVGPVFLGETSYRGEMVGVYEMPSGAVVLVDEHGSALGELGDVELDTFTIPVPDGYAEVYVVPTGPPEYGTITYDAETGQQYIGYDTGRDASLSDKLAHDLELTEGASIYQPLGTDYAYVIDGDGNIVDVYTVPPELEWSLFGIVEYYEDGTVSVDLAVIEIDVDVVGPEKGISVSVDLLIAEGTAGISWDDEGNWEFDVSAEFDVGVAEGGGDLSFGQEDGNFFLEAEAWGAVMVGPLTLDGNVGASFVQTDDGWGASVTAGAGVSSGGLRLGGEARYSVVHDENGTTKTFEMTGIIEQQGVGSIEVTGQFQQQVDREGNKDNSTSAEAVVRDKDGNDVASAGELEDDNWPEDDQDLPVGPGDDAAGAGFDLDHDDEPDDQRDADESGDSGRAGGGRAAAGALGERDDGPARPRVAAAGDRVAGPGGDGVYVQEIPSGVRAAGVAAAGAAASVTPVAGEAGTEADGPHVVFEPNDAPQVDDSVDGRRDRPTDDASPGHDAPAGDRGPRRPGDEFASTAGGSPNVLFEPDAGPRAAIDGQLDERPVRADDIVDVPRAPSHPVDQGRMDDGAATGARADGGLQVRHDVDRPPSEESTPGQEPFDDIVALAASAPSAATRTGRDDRTRDDMGSDPGAVVDVGPTSRSRPIRSWPRSAAGRSAAGRSGADGSHRDERGRRHRHRRRRTRVAVGGRTRDRGGPRPRCTLRRWLRGRRRPRSGRVRRPRRRADGLTGHPLVRRRRTRMAGTGERHLIAATRVGVRFGNLPDGHVVVPGSRCRQPNARHEGADMDAPTLQRLRIPSRDFWTITPFTIATPDGWTAEQTVEHLVYARSGDGSANVSVRWSRVPGALGLEQVATVGFANILRIDKAARVVMTGYGRHRGLRSYLRLVEFTPERGERRGQCYLALNVRTSGADGRSSCSS
jgi:hypothetical protein